MAAGRESSQWNWSETRVRRMLGVLRRAQCRHRGISENSGRALRAILRTGCSIHARGFRFSKLPCGWRYLGYLGEDWRPDKSGRSGRFSDREIPPHYPKRPGIRSCAAPRSTPSPPFPGICLASDRSGGTVVLSVPGPKGHFPRAFLNDALKEAVKTTTSARSKPFCRRP